jgi:hypothetical protein
LLHEVGGDGDDALICVGGERLRVVGDEVRLHPCRAGGQGGLFGQLRLGFLHEGFGVGNGGLGLGLSKKSGGHKNESGK